MNGGIDGVEDAVEVLCDLGVPEAQDPVAFRLQPTAPHIVPLTARLVAV